MQAFVIIKNPSLPVISLNHSSSKNLRRSQQQTKSSCPSMFWARTDSSSRFLCSAVSLSNAALASLPSACYPAIHWSWRKSFKRLWCPLPLLFWGGPAPLSSRRRAWLAFVHFCRVKIEVHNRRDGITHHEDELVICEQPTVRNGRDCQSSTAMYFDTQMVWYIYWPLVAKLRNLKSYHFGNTVLFIVLHFFFFFAVFLLFTNLVALILLYT